MVLYKGVSVGQNWRLLIFTIRESTYGRGKFVLNNIQEYNTEQLVSPEVTVISVQNDTVTVVCKSCTKFNIQEIEFQHGGASKRAQETSIYHADIRTYTMDDFLSKHEPVI